MRISDWSSDVCSSDLGISAKLLQQAHKRIALIGCFRPRQCGIATFTADVYDHLTATGSGIDVDVYAMRSALAQGSDTAITHSIDDDSPVSYRAAAVAINRSAVAAIWLQHERSEEHTSELQSLLRRTY